MRRCFSHAAYCCAFLLPRSAGGRDLLFLLRPGIRLSRSLSAASLQAITSSQKEVTALLFSSLVRRALTIFSMVNSSPMIAFKARRCSNIILNYIKYVGGVDRADQYASTYCFLRKSLKWWRKLFFWGVTTRVSRIDEIYLCRSE